MKDLLNQIHNADCLTFLRTMPDECVDCVVTSPPYWGLRDYGVDGQLGLEPTIELYISHLVEIFGECKRVLKKTGTMWINIGDSYAGSSMTGGLGSGKEIADRMFNKPTVDSNLPSKSLCQIPERLSIALTDQLGLIKRNTIIWYKRNCMPSSASDRFTVDFEYFYFFTKHQDYWFEQQFEEYTEPMNRWGGDRLKANGECIWDNGTGQSTYRDRDMRPNELGRNKRTVWDVPTEPTPDAHFAVFPRALVYTPIKAGCPPNGVVLDPFAGSGTTCLEAKEQGKNYIGIELNPEYIKIADKKLRQEVLPFNQAIGG